jgi:hypothetical protein
MKIVRAAPAELLKRLVGGVLGATAPKRRSTCSASTVANLSGRVLDELVVLPGDQLPVDRPARHHPADVAPRRLAGEAGPVWTGSADALDAWQQPEAERVTEREGGDHGAVRVGVVAVDLGVSAVTQQPFKDRCGLGCRAGLQLTVDAGAVLLDVPVDHHARPR